MPWSPIARPPDESGGADYGFTNLPPLRRFHAIPLPQSASYTDTHTHTHNSEQQKSKFFEKNSFYKRKDEQLWDLINRIDE